MILYRPVGINELRLIFESGLKAFPPRLPEQPIFYPVLYFDYARQIAFEWNTKRQPFAGYVTEFAIDDNYVSQFEKHTVGGHQHQELWIPAENLDEFNHHIIGQIKVAEAHFGKEFRGFIGENTNLKGRDAIAQLIIIVNAYERSPMDVSCEIVANSTAIFLNYPFWLKSDFIAEGIDNNKRLKALEFIKEMWSLSFPELPLCGDLNS
jgi:hypothetical protein